jgi:ABC-type transporter Mla subunit MlaD
MSNAESEDLVTVSRGGIVVEKSFEPNDFPVPAIAFVVRSERDEPVSLELNDTVPDHVPGEDIGFHPKYGAEFWEFEDGEIVFERDFEPHEEYTTVYGLRAADTDNPGQFMSEPEIESVDPPLDDDADDVIGEVVDAAGADGAEPEAGEGGAEADGSDPVGVDIDIAEPDEGESATDAPEPAIERVPTEEEVADDDEPVEPIDLSDPGEESVNLAVEESVEDDEDESTEAEAGADSEADAQAADGASTPDESSPTAVPSVAVDSEGAESGLAATLAAEIRNGEVDDDDLDVLQDALGAETVDNSVGARIEHLQSEIADLKAYSEALEEFIDENGDAQQVIEDIRADFEAATERLDDMEARTSEAVEIAESVDDRLEESIDESEARVDELLEEGEERLDTLADDAEARLDETVETAESQVDELVEEAESHVESELAERTERLEAVEDRAEEALDELDDALDDLEETAEERVEDELDELWVEIDEVAAEMADVTDEVAELREDIGEAAEERIEALEADIEDLEDQIGEVAELRDRLANALGPLGGGGDDGEDAE